MVTKVQKIKKVKKNPEAGKIDMKSDNGYYDHAMIEKKAFELYEKRGREHGWDQEDWFEAEKLLEDE